MNSPGKTPAKGRLLLKSLINLYLDPNNYRFRDAETYTPTIDSESTANDVQRRTENLILGKNGELVKDLIDSFRINGFIRVDSIQAREIEGGKFLVVEGNRRVACLKFLQNRHKTEGYDLGGLDPGIFSKVPVVSYTNADEAHHLILMGLKHISGNKKWPAINQAELVRILYFTHEIEGDDVCRSIGISRKEFNATLNTMALIDLYKASDYGDQFRSEQYSLFLEVIRKPALRTWLGWNDTERTVGHSENLKRLFSWLSEEEIYDEADHEDNWIGQGQKREAVLVKVSHIRELATIIGDEKALSNLDTTRNLSEATLSSEVLGKNKVQNAISLIGQEVNQIFNMVHLVTDSERFDIDSMSKKLSGILDVGRSQSVSASSRNDYLIQPDKGCFFEKVTIEHFRRFNNICLDKLSRINLFAGINNSGKTTILEAIKVLCSLNSPKELIDLVRRRAKTPSERVDMEWFVEQIPEIKLSGVFAGENVSLRLSSESVSVEDETFYLRSAVFAVEYGNSWSSQTHFFEKYPPRTEGKTVSLCPSVFSSPFSGLDTELIKACHSASLREDSKQTVIDFIRKNMDHDIRNIELSENGRFIVVHDEISPNPDLTKFGEGLQRIFNLGLLFAGAKGGVVIIDELENAIHAAILPDLVQLIHQLAIQFNVQVFISSHSKECIDAFINNKSIVKDLSTYALVENDGLIEAVRFPGERMARLVELINFDIRGGKVYRGDGQ